MVPADMAAIAAQLYADGRTANQIAGRVGISTKFAQRLIRTAVAANPGIKDQHDRYQQVRRRHYHPGQGVLMMDGKELVQDVPTAAEQTSLYRVNPWEA